MKILRASHLGMCFGVRDAIDLALNHPEPLTVLGDLVHNETVLRQLRERGVRIDHQPDAVATDTVMITAHGASQRRMAEVRARGLKVLKELGLGYRGPGGQLLRPDEPALAPIWEEAGRLGLPVLIHVADPYGFFQPMTPGNERSPAPRPGWRRGVNLKRAVQSRHAQLYCSF